MECEQSRRFEVRNKQLFARNHEKLEAFESECRNLLGSLFNFD